MTKEAKWSEKEFEEIDLGDERLNRRIIKLAEELSKQPQAYKPSERGLGRCKGGL